LIHSLPAYPRSLLDALAMEFKIGPGSVSRSGRHLLEYRA
jgi:hypothetical protein